MTVGCSDERGVGMMSGLFLCRHVLCYYVVLFRWSPLIAVALVLISIPFRYRMYATVDSYRRILSVNICHL